MSSTVYESPPETVFRIYLRAVMFLFPALLAWAFSTVYLLPKLTQLLSEVTAGPVAQGMFSFSNSLIANFKIVLVAVCLVLVLLEKYQPAFPRYRRAAVDAVTYVLNAAVIITLVMLATLSTGTALSLVKSATPPSVPAPASAPAPTPVTP